VRYCLNTANPAKEVLWRQVQTWTTDVAPALPSTAACPGTGWNAGADVQYVSGVVNRYGGADRAVFTYNSSDVSRVSKVRTSLFIDANPTKRPAETRLSSGVFLRNQNRIPAASFTATVTADKRLILNGSGSEDPEGMPLKYQWYVDAPSPLPSCSASPVPASCLGEGVVFEKTGLSGGGSHVITLVVKDPAELGGTATQTVTYPN
jgi:hypothetical protein